jgi:hypothetical protein
LGICPAFHLCQPYLAFRVKGRQRQQKQECFFHGFNETFWPGARTPRSPFWCYDYDSGLLRGKHGEPKRFFRSRAIFSSDHGKAIFAEKAFVWTKNTLFPTSLTPCNKSIFQNDLVRKIFLPKKKA